VHSARKALKRIRAVLRLLAQCRHDTPVLEEERHWYRDTGRLLQHLRDGDVLPQTLAHLLEDHPDTIPERASDKLEAALGVEHAAKEVDRLLRQVDKRVVRGLKRLERRQVLPIPREMLCAALRATYFRAALAMERALRSGHDDPYHEWRKRAKELWYQAQLLERLCPPEPADLVSTLDTLQNGLGDAQDLTVLLHALEPMKGKAVKPAHKKALVALAEEERRKLWDTCESLGREIFPATPFGRP
jgi:CHAD domain-containing protein